ncbi:MAG: hypothetical protein HYZ85_04215 [Candidatus Omnitrophica bacterium]|nr:hypothetical protein [Candidatus Omnitrophota bacterium]
MLRENNDANVNDNAKNLEESVGLFTEILQIHCEFGNSVLFDDVVVTEWVQLDIVIVGPYRRRKARLPEIDFTHVEVEEEIPSGIAEAVEEIVADSLFVLWLSEKGVRN